jgi:hypothetical protein
MQSLQTAMSLSKQTAPPQQVICGAGAATCQCIAQGGFFRPEEILYQKFSTLLDSRFAAMPRIL